MKLILANPRGFCAGVQMAVDVVDQVLDLFPGETIYVYHDIVHNRHVVGRFTDRGVVFVEDLEDVPEGSIVVFSAHGIPPQLREQARAGNLDAIDATCPLVTKVHSEAIRYRRQGYHILLIGHRNHQEVIGTMGEAPDVTTVVESPEEAETVRVEDPSRLAYLTQTTLSTDDAEAIISVLQRRFPQIKEPPGSDICYATTNRQHAVRQIAPECDVVLVVGSTNSSNSKRLTEISRNVGTPAHLLDDASGFDPAWLPRGGDSTVMITAGASAPEDLVAGLCKHLLTTFGGSIEQRDITPEHVEFALPAALRRKMTDRGIDPASRRIVVGDKPITADLYGGVPLTVGATGG